MKVGLAALPAWTEEAGGTKRWKKWLETKVRSCVRRAMAWAEKRQIPADQLPLAGVWRSAILDALHISKGRGRYSQFSLSLADKRSTDWSWPSVDHLGNPAEPTIAIETRLVNDMKTIMSDAEFRAMIGHLAAVLRVEVQEDQSWNCARSFAAAETTDEPPLPE